MSSRFARVAAPLLLTVPALTGVACKVTETECFGGSTWISLRRGRKRLRDIRVGDVVQSFDVGTGRLSESPVVQVLRHERRAVGQLLSARGTGPRSVTGNHPIFVEPLGQFAAAGELDRQHVQRRGLYWDDHDLRAIELEPYRAAPLGHLLEVYNLTIEGTETYFADGLLVHNKSCDPNVCGYHPGTGGLGTGGAVGGAGGAPTGGEAGSSGAAGEGGGAGAAGGDP